VAAAAPYRTILVPIDLSEFELSKSAIQRAAAVAEDSGGALRLINVQSLLPPMMMDYVPVDYDAAQQERAEAQLAQAALGVPLPQERVSTRVRIGGIYQQILAEAEEFGADLIVIGSHRPAMSTYLLGSNATSVVRHAKCSVLVVRSQA